jgi:hypothetical protein
MTKAFRVISAGLVVLVLLIYGGTARNGFVEYDDDAYLYRNPVVGRGVTGEGVAWAFTSVGYASNWHPLTWLSHMADVSLFGMRPGPMHLVGAGLHAVNAVLVLAVLAGMTGALWKSALVAALFAVHPLHVQSVAWASERKDVLSTLFWLLVMLAWVGWARRPSPGRYLAALVLFAAGLLAKPMLVTLPLILLLMDGWPLGRLRGLTPGGTVGAARAVIEKAPFLLLAAGSSVLTVVAQSKAIDTLTNTGLAERAANAVVAAGAYLRLTILPVGLACFYPQPPEGWPSGTILASGGCG